VKQTGNSAKSHNYLCEFVLLGWTNIFSACSPAYRLLHISLQIKFAIIERGICCSAC